MQEDIERCDCGGRQRLEQPSVCSNHFRDIELTSTPKVRNHRRLFHQNLANHGTSADDTAMVLTGSRQEFLPGEAGGTTITYNRKGGFFVTIKGVVIIVLAALLFALIVGILVHLFVPRGDSEKVAVEDDESWNIGKIYVRNVDDNIRLPTGIIPTFYRLRIKPNYTAFTFEGSVAITLHTDKTNIKHISLHAKDLEILNNTILTEQQLFTSEMKMGNQSPNRTRRGFVNSTDSSSDVTTTILPELEKAEDVATDFPEQEPTTSESEAWTELSVISDVKEVDLKNATEIENSTDYPQNISDIIRAVINHSPPKSNISLTRNEHKQQSNETHILTQIKIKHMKIISKELRPSIDRLIFTLEAHLKPNVNYTLEISFRGKIDESLTGFYRSDFINNNTEQTLLVTQFEPTSARKAFPCFDEPNFKAMFEISIARPENMTAVSNMPLADEEPIKGEDMVWSHFERSIPMSPYLVGYTISDLVPLESKSIITGDVEIPFKIWTRKELVQQTQYASEVGPKIFQFYMKYFGVPYALPKIDLLGIPDFATGAMENWGMLTFSETCLLLDPESDSLKSKKSIATVLAHELSHQWFGNLVTMKWWTDLWLNEGFATYLEYIGIDAIEPSWGMLDQFSSDRMHIMATDCTETTRPVSDLVNDETQIAQIFDDISYMKAASLLRMLNHILTEEVFHKGLVQYMKKWQYSNADQNDLWWAFTEAANETSVLPEKVTIADLMKTWTLQAGYPVINVIRNYSNGTATVTQNRFYLSNPSKLTNELWYVPITYAVGNTNLDTWDTTPKAWLEKQPTTSILLPESANGTWVYFNVLGIGHYRVNYDTANWKLLQYALDDAYNDFSIVTRAQLLDDAFNLARAGQLNYSIALDLTKYMIGIETEVLPWDSVLENLLFLDDVMQRSKKYSLFQEYISILIMPTMKQSGYVPSGNDTVHELILREKLIDWACLIEEQECIDWAWIHFNNWLNQSDPDKTNPIPFSSRGTVYETVLRLGSKKEYEFLYSRFKNSNDPEVRMEIIGALPSTRNTWQLLSLFDFSITSMDTHLTPALWNGLKSDIASQTAFKFVTSNWERVNAKYALIDEQIFQSVISAAFGRISSEQELRQFKRFISANKKDLKNVSAIIMKRLEDAVLRIQWRKTKMEDVERWLEKFIKTRKMEMESIIETPTFYLEKYIVRINNTCVKT